MNALQGQRAAAYKRQPSQPCIWASEYALPGQIAHGHQILAASFLPSEARTYSVGPCVEPKMGDRDGRLCKLPCFARRQGPRNSKGNRMRIIPRRHLACATQPVNEWSTWRLAPPVQPAKIAAMKPKRLHRPTVFADYRKAVNMYGLSTL